MRKHISLLEDNDDLRELITYFLEEENFMVDGYADVSTFRAGLALSVPDIFIMDIQLPDGNGVDVCKETKNDPKTNHIPVILMSANRHGKLLATGCEAEAFIDKPFDINNFVAKVNFYLYK